ncbi:hypothetical protein A0H81_12905 [Grifola frondosa]|uniref:SEC7 domain-containing protein n=1 Tax=Grifola frondosa TaxID=5627 RepID=A0A1C7LR11_GRIFR|nr:hypothetical protein A0H81_12905 [Grifola frondosa]
MKDGRRPPMHVEAVSEGERSHSEDRPDDVSAQEANESFDQGSAFDMSAEEPREENVGDRVVEHEDHVEENAGNAEEPAVKVEVEEVEIAPPETSPPAENTPVRAKRRSRSRTRSRGSKDFKGKAKQCPQASSASHTNESSADEYYASAPGEDAPPSPPLVSPVPSRFARFPIPQLLRSAVNPVSPLFYPGTTPSTPLPSLDEIQKGVGSGLFRSNSAGAARAMAMQKLTGGTEPLDFMFISPSPTPPLPGVRLVRNNTVAGGERMAARRLMLHRLNNRIKEADGDQTSGGEEAPPPTLPPKRRRRRSKRSSSRASTLVDDRDDREPTSTSPNTPIVPPSPLPPLFHNAPEPPRPPSPTDRSALDEASPRVKPNGNVPYDYEAPLGHRGVVVEDEDDVPERLSPPRLSPPNLPATLARGHRLPSGIRIPHTSDVPSNASTDSARGSAVGVPIFLSQDPAYRQDVFPASPFATPLKERAYPEEDEQVLYQELRSRTRVAATNAFERESDISWVADPVPERMPLHDDDDEDDEDEVEPEIEDVDETVPETTDHRSSRSSARRPPSLKGLVVDLEMSPEASPAHVPPSPSSVAALSTAAASDHHLEAQASPPTYPMRLSVATPNQLDRSPSAGGDFLEWDDSRAESTPKRGQDSGSTSAWGKVKNTFTRTGSSNGRRSRTNSLSTRTEKVDTSGVFATQQAQSPLMETPSASTSILSLAPQSAPPGGVSPIPPASSADLMRYADSKLFPFPGMRQLEEQRNRAKGLSLSASTPDVVLPTNGLGIEAVPSSSSSNTATRFPDRLPPRIRIISASPRILPYSSGSLKLPMNREGVKKWLKVFTSQSSSSAPPTAIAQSLTPTADPRPRAAVKKPSLSDLLMHRKESELTADWEDVGSDKVQTVQSPRIEPNPQMNAGSNGPTSLYTGLDFSSPAFPSPPEPPSSATPDPQSSLDDSTTRSTSDSFSSTVSSSHHSPDPPHAGPSRGTIIMERLEEVLGRGSKSSLWPAAVDGPSRKLVLSSPVLQVANANTVKDRFLFLFTDILVIAKPIVHDQDALLDTVKPNPSDRKFVVKSAVHLRELRFHGDRDDSRTKALNTANPMRHPVIRSFVHHFGKDPDYAITTLFEKTNTKDDPIALGQLIFRCLDLDRARLGEYLSRRTSKVVLKAYVDNFGLTGLRIDKSFRVFLQSVHIPAKVLGSHSSPLEYLLDAFASRWYEANAGIVAYDKDLAIRLVRAIVQLNEVMHGGIAHEPGITGYPKRNVMTRDFVEAFRRLDPRGLVSDELLDKIYVSIRREKLSQARNPSSQTGHPDVPITIKRPLPPRLTYRVQSDPIILRIPQPDPQLTIQLFGQDLIFDPPVLAFAKSSEASFRITGTSLGSKTIIMWRSGPNALAYSGLPLSSPVMVERAFMRNTFQVAFLNHSGTKRKYMFSVDDPVLRHQWVVSLKQHIDSASSITSLPSEMSGSSSSRANRAAEDLAFRVLQETLIGTDGSDESSVSPSAIDQALARLTGVSITRTTRSGSVSSMFGSTAPLNISSLRRRSRHDGPNHARSKSRSQVYHRHGAGKLEQELTDGPDSQGDESQDTSGQSLQLRFEGRLWSGHDLEVVCRQNSSIASVLAYLQGGQADNENHTNGLVYDFGLICSPFYYIVVVWFRYDCMHVPLCVISRLVLISSSWSILWTLLVI